MSTVEMWDGGSEFQSDMDKFFRQPAQHPERTHPLFNPRPHMYAIYGRPGMQKLRCVEAYFSHIRQKSVSVEFGKTALAIASIQNHLAFISSAPAAPNEDGGALPLMTDVLFIDHFNVLLEYPDSEAVMEVLISLSELAAASRLTIVALFDRVVSSEEGRANGNTIAFRRAVLKQFTVKFFFSCPHSLYRRRLLKSLLDGAADYYSNGGGKVALRIDMAEGSYSNMETFTAYASVEDIVHFVHKVINDAVSDCPASVEKETPRTINFDTLRYHLSTKTGTPHILDYSPLNAENELRVYCGKGSEGNASKKLSYTAENVVPSVMKKEPLLEGGGGGAESKKKRQKVSKKNEEEGIVEEAPNTKY